MPQGIEASARERCESRGADLVEASGQGDHVHLLVSLPPNVALSEYVYALKTNTARVLRRDFPRELARVYSEPVLWSRFCEAGSVKPQLLRHQRWRGSTGGPQTLHRRAAETAVNDLIEAATGLTVRQPGADSPDHQAIRLAPLGNCAASSLGGDPLGYAGW